jgi:hypothetical protein
LQSTITTSTKGQLLTQLPNLVRGSNYNKTIDSQGYAKMKSLPRYSNWQKNAKGNIVAEDYNLWFFCLQFTIFITEKIRPKRRGDTFINMQIQH